MQNGSVKRFEAIARPNAVGMTILVRGLFDGLPVRKRALRVDREMAQLKRALEAMALRFHHVTFTMSLNAVQQTCIKKLPQSDDLKVWRGISGGLFTLP